jgi:hypothetical protein
LLTEREDKAEAKTPAVASTPKSKKAVKRNPDQREMLLPIAGSGKGKEAAKEPAPGRRKAS